MTDVGGGEPLDDIAALLVEPTVPAHVLRRPPSIAEITAAAAQALLPLRLSVVWGDLTKVAADLHLSGHYQGVLPTSAELALDRAISVGADGAFRTGRGVIEEFTRRRWLVEHLGVVSYFPVSQPGSMKRAAIVSLGRVGTFNHGRAVQLWESVVTRLSSLGSVTSAATVLIGSGAGTLSVDHAAAALLQGVSKGRRGHLTATPGQPPLDRLIVVERDRSRADLVHAALRAAVAATPEIVLDGGVEIGVNGTVSQSAAVDLIAKALARLAYDGGDNTGGDPNIRASLDVAYAHLGEPVADLVREQLEKLSDDIDPAHGAARRNPNAGSQARAGTRLSVFQDQKGSLRWGAITDRATVSERILPAQPSVIDQLVTRLERPAAKDLSRLAEGLSRLLVPVDMQALLGDEAPLVVEVDRTPARLQWEMLVDVNAMGVKQDEPLALRTPIARQLRTTYSRPGAAVDEEDARRILVVGDPGDPATNRSLAGARYEATEVAAVVGGKTAKERGWELKLFLGAPQAAPPDATAPLTPAADLLEVLIELTTGKHQVVHFAGHGMYDPADPERRAGLLFSGGLLTSQDLMNLPRPPRLVVANACFSSKVTPVADRETRPPTVLESLAPTLADEFLRAGVVHFIGAAWKVHDLAGAEFATAFYRALFTPATTVGDAVCAGRRAVWSKRERFGCDWAAYQHYGDPSDILVRE